MTKGSAIRVLAAITLAFALLTGMCAADYIDTGQLENALTPDARQSLQGINPKDADVKTGFTGLGRRALDFLQQYLREATGAGFAILAICVLVSLGSGFAKASGLDIPDKIADVTAVCAILLVCLTMNGSVISECAAAIKNIDSFSNFLIPAFGIATAVSGRPVTAAASAGATMVFSKVLISLSLGVFIPALYLYITASAAAAMSDSPLISKITDFIKWISTAFFRGSMIIFTAYISFSGIVSGSADAVAVKTAQVTLSGVVPVVGGIISGVSESLLAGAGLLKASIGVYGFMGACAICLAPFVRTLSHLLVFKVLAAFSTSFAGGGASRLLNGVCTAYSMALGLLGTCCMLQFVSIVVSAVVTNT